MPWDEEDEKQHQAEMQRIKADMELEDRHFVHEMFTHYVAEGFAEIDAGMRAIKALDDLDGLLGARRKRKK